MVVRRDSRRDPEPSHFPRSRWVQKTWSEIARESAARRWLGVVVNDLGSLAKAHMAQAREQIRELVGEIRLAPTADGYLEAVLTGRYEGLLKLAVGTKLNNMVAGERF